MAIVAERFVERLGVVSIKYTNDDPTKKVPEPVDLFEMQVCRHGIYYCTNNWIPKIYCPN